MHPRYVVLLAGLGALDVGYIDFVLGPRIVASNSSSGGMPVSLFAAVSKKPKAAAGPVTAAPAPIAPAPIAPAPTPPAQTPPAQTLATPLAAPAPEARAPEPPDLRGPPGATWWIVSFPEAGQVTLSEAAEQQLAQIAARFATSHDIRINIVGHADARGEDTLNDRLGTLRARAVAEALERAGFRPGQVAIGSRGEAAPAVLGGDAVAWAANRRAEIEVVTTPKSKPLGANTE